MLSRGTGNMLIAEDLNGTVKLDLRNVEYEPALYFEGGIYIFEGLYNSGTLMLERISLPSLASDLKLEKEETIAKKRSTTSKDMIVFLSEVHLDNERVISKSY